MSDTICENAEFIDKKLEEITVCDPAVGSGAFPVGMMNEIVKVRNVLSVYLKDAREDERKIHILKSQCIEHSLYGVDIDPGAVEIAKLRLWLSLVVDEDNIKNIKPLPNLDYKIMQGNSLLHIERRLDNYKLFSELEELKPLFFKETNVNQKKRHKDRIDELINQITDGHKEFDFEVYFSEVFHKRKGFDVVIANPPYGFRGVLSSEEKKYFRKKKGISFPSGDIAELFVFISYKGLIREKGIQTFIIPKKSLYGESWKDTRKLWISAKLLYLMDASKAFEQVLLEQVSFSLMKGGGKDKIIISALDQVHNRIQTFGKFFLKNIFTNNLCNAQIYKGLYPKGLLKKISQYSQTDSSTLIKAEIGISNITKHLTFEAQGNKPCIKGSDIKKYCLKNQRYLKGNVAAKYTYDYRDKIVAQKIIAHIQNPFPHISITMLYDDSGRLINDTCVEIKPLEPRLLKKFLLAYLQSTFCNWYAYNLIYNRAIRTMDFINYYVTQIPIPAKVIKENEKQQPIINLVNKILEAKENNPNVDTSHWEKQIDQLVYQLYDLTPEEIRIVEGKEQ